MRLQNRDLLDHQRAGPRTRRMAPQGTVRRRMHYEQTRGAA